MQSTEPFEESAPHSPIRDSASDAQTCLLTNWDLPLNYDGFVSFLVRNYAAVWLVNLAP